MMMKINGTGLGGNQRQIWWIILRRTPKVSDGPDKMYRIETNEKQKAGGQLVILLVLENSG